MASIPRTKRDVRIVLAASALLSFTSASRAAALALPELALPPLPAFSKTL